MPTSCSRVSKRRLEQNSELTLKEFYTQCLGLAPLAKVWPDMEDLVRFLALHTKYVLLTLQEMQGFDGLSALLKTRLATDATALAECVDEVAGSDSSLNDRSAWTSKWATLLDGLSRLNVADAAPPKTEEEWKKERGLINLKLGPLNVQQLKAKILKADTRATVDGKNKAQLQASFADLASEVKRKDDLKKDKTWAARGLTSSSM